MTFIPTPFSAPVVAPEPYAATSYRKTPYISPSEYRFAPTAVATGNMVPGSQQQTADSLASLATEIMRASAWIDEFCFHRAEGSLACSLTTEHDKIKPKNDGTLMLICNFKPIVEVIGMGVGPTPSQISNLQQPVNMNIEGKVIELPSGWTWSPPTSFPQFTWSGAYVYAVWQYVHGYPLFELATACTVGATSIQVTNAVPGQAIYGVFPGTPLVITDGAETETVFASTVSGTTINLQGAGTAFAHTPPGAPDFIKVSALPYGIEQAAVSITSLLTKMRGVRSFILPAGAGGMPQGTRKALAQAGALDDYTVACQLLKPFQSVFLHA